MKFVTFVWLFCSIVLVLAGNERNDSTPPEDPKPFVEPTIHGAVAVAGPPVAALVAGPPVAALVAAPPAAAPAPHHGNLLEMLIVMHFVILVSKAIKLSDSMQRHADALATATFQHPRLLELGFGVYMAALYGFLALVSSLVLHPIGSLAQFIAFSLSSAELARLYQGYAPADTTEASAFLSTTAQTTVYLQVAVFACYVFMLIRSWLS